MSRFTRIYKVLSPEKRRGLRTEFADKLVKAAACYGYRMGMDEAYFLLENLGFVSEILRELHRASRHAESSHLMMYIIGKQSYVGGGKQCTLFSLENILEA